MKNCKKNIILHVGLPKTASSFLQLEIFPNLKNVYVTGNGDRKVKRTPFRLFYHYKQNIQLSRDNELPLFTSGRVLKRFRKNAVRFINRKAEDTFLFSCEGLVGVVECAYYNFEERARRYHHVFPEAKVIFVIRKQDDWVESFYNQTVLKGTRFPQGLPINSFIGYENGEFHTHGDYQNIYDLDYLKIIQHYISLFGKDNILTLSYELFKQRPEQFLQQIYDFSGVEPYYPEDFSKQVNTRKSVDLDRPKTPSSEHSSPAPEGEEMKVPPVNELKGSSDKTLSETQRDQIMSIHRESNKALSELIGFNLSEYDYH